MPDTEYSRINELIGQPSFNAGDVLAIDNPAAEETQKITAVDLAAAVNALAPPAVPSKGYWLPEDPPATATGWRPQFGGNYSGSSWMTISFASASPPNNAAIFKFYWLFTWLDHTTEDISIWIRPSGISDTSGAGIARFSYTYNQGYAEIPNINNSFDFRVVGTSTAFTFRTYLMGAILDQTV